MAFFKFTSSEISHLHDELSNSGGQIVALFALTNLWLARKRLMPLMGEVRP